MATVPKILQYSGVKPRGFASSFRRWEVFPQTSYQVYTNQDIIRFNFQTPQFFDPYTTYLEVEVTFDPADYGGLTVNNNSKPAFMLDGPSTSLVSQLVIYSNSKEIERIQQYDTLGNVLSDLGMPIESRAFKFYEGYSYQRQYANNETAKVANNGFSFYNPNRTADYNTGSLQPAGYFPGQEAVFLGNMATQYAQIASNVMPTGPYFSSSENDMLRYGGLAMQNITAANRHYFTTPGQVSAGLRDRFNAAQVYATTRSDDGCQSYTAPQSTPLGDTAAFINSPAALTDASITNEVSPWNYPTFCGNQVPFNFGSAFCHYSIMTPLYPTLRVINGVGNANIPVGKLLNNTGTPECLMGTITKRTFYVPLLSGTLGSMIPKDNYKLIPGEGCGLLTFEWTMNPFAFFASGINDAALYASGFHPPGNFGKGPTESQLLQYQWRMLWKVTKISMHFDLWMFDDSVVSQTRAALQSPEGIVITSLGQTLGPMYSITNTPSVTNTWHINNGILSLRNILFFFLDNAYQKYSFLRKHVRLSQNLVSMQLKVGTDYIPQTPIIGHAGNLAKNNIIKADCTAFFTELVRAYGYLFNPSHKMFITPQQFVLNERGWDYDSSKNGFGSLDVLGQQCIYHETRNPGKALYCFDLLSDQHDHSVLSGLDTTKVRPIELVLQSQSDSFNNGDFNKPSTLMMFLVHDILVSFKMGELDAVGFG